MPLQTVPGNIQGKTRSFEETSFTAAKSPVSINLNGRLSHNAVDGYLVNDGPGDFAIEISDNGTDYGDSHTIKSGEVLELDYLNAHTIKITHSGTDSAYRILVI